MEQHVVNEVVKTDSFFFLRLLDSAKQTCGTDTKNKLMPNTVHVFLSFHAYTSYLFFSLLRNPVLGKALRRGP